MGRHQAKVPQVTGDSEGNQVTYCYFRGQNHRVISWTIPNIYNSSVKTTAFACLEGLPGILGKAIGRTEAIAKLGYELDRIERKQKHA